MTKLGEFSLGQVAAVQVFEQGHFVEKLFNENLSKALVQDCVADTLLYRESYRRSKFTRCCATGANETNDGS